ncbi:alkaline phosphatase family protein [Puteibacter caeruleilacunae]|nr:alkaline phosphatase family protein [Puteibacter caeruleilacunae]
MEIKNVLKNRFGGIIIFGAIFLVLSFTIRTVLLITDLNNVDLNLLKFIQIYGYGLFYDLVTISYFIVPFVIYLLIAPDFIFRTKIHRWIAYVFFIITIGILVFSAIGEWFFWEEFNVRYNFIAVDYLVYTHEVIANIRESYPMPLIILGMLLVSSGIFMLVRRRFETTMQCETPFKSRLKVCLILLALPLMAFYSVDKTSAEIEDNTYSNELAHNGIYQIFAAFRNNELDYETFYRNTSDDEAFKKLRKLIKTSGSKFISNDLFDVTRQITYPGDDKKYNVMMITVESLSGSFFKRFGNQDRITPNMDTIAQKSLFFTNFYATGTRTVRGMEALTLSLPPTPGYSIIKRPKNENMFTLGNVLKSKGYATNFIYAGNGYFDNMNYFFGHSGYKIVDRDSFNDDEVTFENAWGVCDEDLFAKAMRVADEDHQLGKPFHSFIMTTSNHRPYTYPEGKIDIPSHTGRKGAVKYTDYAIAKFLREARKHAWYDNTIFVIVADHCASSAGKTSLPVKRYHIPLIVYAPGIIEAKEVNTLASQIDFAPTIMGLLNMDYQSKFFGKDILHDNPDRALIGTYQKIGYLKQDKLTVQLPTKRIESYNVTGDKQYKTELNPELLNESIAYYQAASYLFKNKGFNFVVR